jgi:hypothetical protein
MDEMGLNLFRQEIGKLEINLRTQSMTVGRLGVGSLTCEQACSGYEIDWKWNFRHRLCS